MKIFPLSYSIPREKIKGLRILNDKKRELSFVVPGKVREHNYSYDTEVSYYNQYEESKYAITKKKGGWDCLRHYEILMNGGLPIFLDIENCPINTMKYFPKKDIINIKNKYENILQNYFKD